MSPLDWELLLEKYNHVSFLGAEQECSEYENMRTHEQAICLLPVYWHSTQKREEKCYPHCLLCVRHCVRCSVNPISNIVSIAAFALQTRKLSLKTWSDWPEIIQLISSRAEIFTALWVDMQGPLDEHSNVNVQSWCPLQLLLSIARTKRMAYRLPSVLYQSSLTTLCVPCLGCV